MDIVSNNIPQVSSVRTVTSLNYIKRTYNLPVESNNSFDKQISDESKNSIVSDQQGNNVSTAAYNYQYQSNVPVSLLSTTNQPFNETVKPSIIKSAPASNDEPENSDYYVEEAPEKTNNKSLGYYIIDSKAPLSANRRQKLNNPMQDRINKTYKLNYGIEPGTIVNITLY